MEVWSDERRGGCRCVGELPDLGMVLLRGSGRISAVHRPLRTPPESARDTILRSPVDVGGWIAISLAFGGFIWSITGTAVAIEYYAAYLVEWSLSLDNVFVFSVIFTSFAVPR